MKTALRIWILFSILAVPLSAAVLTVPGDANIFGAGHSYLPAPGGGMSTDETVSWICRFVPCART